MRDLLFSELKTNLGLSSAWKLKEKRNSSPCFRLVWTCLCLGVTEFEQNTVNPFKQETSSLLWCVSCSNLFSAKSPAYEISHTDHHVCVMRQVHKATVHPGVKSTRTRPRRSTATVQDRRVNATTHLGTAAGYAASRQALAQTACSHCSCSEQLSVVLLSTYFCLYCTAVNYYL